MKPYYHEEKSGITIYHGDCREVMPQLKADAVVTDPPYGIGLGSTKGSGGGHGLSLAEYASYDDSYENFCSIIVPAINSALDLCERGVVWTGPHIHEQRKPDALGGVFCPAASGRHCWGFKHLLPVLLYGSAPGLNKGATQPTCIRSNERAEKNGHPVPKPIGWMKWTVALASLEGETIIDPFMGSGTTLRAAKDLGRKAIGIELEERYCETAAKRLSQETLFGVT